MTKDDAVQPPRDTRAEIIRATAELLETRGIGAVMLRAVGSKVGVTRTTPYRHFKDKEGLLVAVASQYFAQLKDAMSAAAVSETDPLRRLEVIALAYIHFVLDHPAKYRLMLGPEVRDSDTVEVAAHEVFELLTEAVAACQDTGHLRAGDTLRLSALIFASVHGVLDLSLAGHVSAAKGLDGAEIIRFLLRQLHQVERS